MDCKSLRERISDYLDGQLPDAERRELAAHLDACQACRAEVEAFQKTVDLVRDLPLTPAPEGLADRIFERTLHLAPGAAAAPAAAPGGLAAFLPVLRGVAAAAVLFLFAYVGYQVVERENVSKAPAEEREALAAPTSRAAGLRSDAAPGLLRVDQKAKEAAPAAEAIRKLRSQAGAPGSDGAEEPEKMERSLLEEKQKGLKDDGPAPAYGDSGRDKEAPGAPKAEEESKDLKDAESAEGQSEPTGGDAGGEPRAQDSIGSPAESGSRSRGGARPAPDPLPVTLVVYAEDLSAERTKVESILRGLRAQERRAFGGRAARLEGAPAGAPSPDRKEAEKKDEAWAGPERLKGAGAGEGGATPPGAEGSPAGGAATPAAPPREPAPAEGATEGDAPDPEKQNLEARKHEDAKKPGQAGKPEAPAAGPSPALAGFLATKDARTIEIRLTLSEYRRFKRQLAESPSRFFEQPSNQLLGQLRKELARKAEVDSDADGNALEDGANGAGREAAEKLQKEGRGAAAEPSVVLTLRFEAEPPAPAPAAPAAKAAAGDEGKKKGD
ncbi:MAG: zf-HC2 domain-containing protein [Planctomycetes bacterium]|nr:zf-HC2 domain-containing protein [Planctomycetota bacterium]